MFGSYAPLESEVLAETVLDLLGCFWRFTYPTSHLGAIRIKREEVKKK